MIEHLYAAMRNVQILFPKDLDIGCFMILFISSTLDELISAWIYLFSHSPKSRLLWKERTGRSVKSFTKTQWWSKWEVINAVMELFGIEPFLLEYDNSSSCTCDHLLSILQNGVKRAMLMVKMAAVVDAGRVYEDYLHSGR